MAKYNWTDDQIIIAVSKSNSITETLENLGSASKSGRPFVRLRDRIESLNLDISNFGKNPRQFTSRAKDWTGQKFYHITMVSSTHIKSKEGSILWNAKCDCGNTMIVVPGIVKNAGGKRHCGCIVRTTSKKPTAPKPPKKSSQKDIDRATNWNARKPPEHKMYNAARRRAEKKGIPFNIEISDIIIPKVCPILGIELRASKKRPSANSPSLDKIIPELGYVKGNIQVISWRANIIKHDASLDELQKIVDYIKDHLTRH